jgi:membrane associated rhomboid family serine protease
MSSGPDLSLVCKSCGAEVSPYITECPYCGARVQKRAPKLDRGGVPRAPKKARSRPQLPRLRPGEIPGIRADRRPWATWLLVLGAVLVTVGIKSRLLQLDDFVYASSAYDAPWRAAASLFAYTHTGYEIAVVGAVALFGWLLERRHGAWATLLVFGLAGAGGAYVNIRFAGPDAILGANGAALGLLAAWAMRDVLGRRAGREDESDLLGVLAIAALLVLLPLASDEAGGVAGLVGGAIGVVLGLLLARLPER